MCFEAPKRAGNYFVLCSGGSELRSRYSRKPQNPFQRKRLRELVPRLLQQAPKRVKSILGDLQKSCAASCAPHGKARLVGRVMQLARRGGCAPFFVIASRRGAEDCAPYLYVRCEALKPSHLWLQISGRKTLKSLSALRF